MCSFSWSKFLLLNNNPRQGPDSFEGTIISYLTHVPPFFPSLRKAKFSALELYPNKQLSLLQPATKMISYHIKLC